MSEPEHDDLRSVERSCRRWRRLALGLVAVVILAVATATWYRILYYRAVQDAEANVARTEQMVQQERERAEQFLCEAQRQRDSSDRVVRQYEIDMRIARTALKEFQDQLEKVKKEREN
jgi:hypothetical protein